MAKKQIYRTVIQLEVLSDEPISSGMALSEIADNCENGDFSGCSEWIVTNVPVKGIKAVKLIMAQGSMPEFFNMDDKGNEVDSDY
jgi:hypothetical protein